jgi:hypothetical protein
MVAFRNTCLAMIAVRTADVALGRVVAAVNATVNASRPVKLFASGRAATSTATA